ncbi:hypothetical protein FRB99_009027, partial [Tulasnella sp. 403]
VEKLREEKADVVIVTLGTTRAIAGSAENFTRIDSQYPIAAAKAARVTSSDEGVTNKPQRLIYLSSTSANPHSFIFYARSKGETECALAGLGYDDFIVFRPGLLVEAERQDSRTLESLYGKITGVLSHFSSNLQVSVKVLAQALVKTGELDFGKDGKAQLPECAEAAVASWQGTVPYPWICNRGPALAVFRRLQPRVSYFESMEKNLDFSPPNTACMAESPQPPNLHVRIPTDEEESITPSSSSKHGGARALVVFAIVLAAISDVTALFNTNAFWAYVLSAFFSGTTSRPQWEVRKLLAVLTACAGVYAVVYGSSQPSGHTAEPPTTESTRRSFYFNMSSTIFGDFLALTSSFAYGLYQVLYKRFAVIPSDEALLPPLTPISTPYQPLLVADDPDPDESAASDDNTPGDGTPTPSSPVISRPPTKQYLGSVPPPFAFHPNFLTSLIGLVTLLLLWIPVPMMSKIGVGDPFQFPPNLKTWGFVGLIATTGVFFNAGFMVLLGIWGPVIASVGNLLTIVLVLMSDVMFGNGIQTITLWRVLGCTMIVGAFAILAFDMMRS